MRERKKLFVRVYAFVCVRLRYVHPRFLYREVGKVKENPKREKKLFVSVSVVLLFLVFVSPPYFYSVQLLRHVCEPA